MKARQIQFQNQNQDVPKPRDAFFERGDGELLQVLPQFAVRLQGVVIRCRAPGCAHFLAQQLNTQTTNADSRKVTRILSERASNELGVVVATHSQTT